MATLLLRFPGRRYHATPWGHHVNEGLIEWPPSPWRLLRALLSVGYTTGRWNGAGPDALAQGLIEALAEVLPTYRLPPAVGAHSRHYMPGGFIEKAREATTLVFDAWAEVGDGQLSVTWDVDLTPEQTALLARLAEDLGYVGRSESWVVARLLGVDEAVPPGAECGPSNDPGELCRGMEQVTLMAPLAARVYADWRTAATAADAGTAHAPNPTRRPRGKDAQQLDAYPADLVSALQVDTTWLRKHGWSQPPGSQRALYWRPADALEVAPLAARTRSPQSPCVDAILLSLTGTTDSRGLLPHVTRTLPHAEFLHRAFVSQIDRLGCTHSRVLIGRDEEGRPLRTAHEHAHVWPLDLDGDDHLDHVVVWAPMGLDADAQCAVRAVRRTFTKGRREELRLAVAGSGRLQDFGSLPGSVGDRLREVFPPTAGSETWASVTPFVPPRYTKRAGRNTLEGQIGQELTSRGFPEPRAISVTEPRDDEIARRMRHFVRTRSRGPAPPVDVGLRVLLQFAEPVKGPLALGYGSHFGLGLFAAHQRSV